MNNRLLRSISSGKKIVIGPTSGRDLTDESELINWTDNEFQPDLADTKRKPTRKVPIEIFETIEEDLSSKQIFKSFKKRLNRLCFSWGQIVRFYEDHHEWHGREFSGNTLMLYKVGRTFFVAQLFFNTGRYMINIRLLSEDMTWYEADRVVIPKLGR